MRTAMPMLERIIRYAIAHRWLMLLLTAALAALGAWNFTRLPDRRHTGHHQCPGANQYAGTRVFGVGSRAARHVPDRDGTRWPCAARWYVFALTLRPRRTFVAKSVVLMSGAIWILA